jgi:signal transduction histidine kinase
MKKYLFLVFLAGTHLSASAQSTAELDSLLRLRKQSQTVTENIIALKALSKYFQHNDLSKAALYADSGIQLANQSAAFTSHLPALYLLKGIAFRKQSVLGEALKSFDEGLAIALQIKDTSNEARFYSEQASVAHTDGEMAKALALDQKALDLFIALKDTGGITESYNNIGVIYWSEEERTKAMIFYKKAVAMNSSHLITKARLLNNIGLVFQDVDQYDSALWYFNEALRALDHKKNSYGYALINNNIGISYRDSKRYDLALSHFAIALQLQTELNDRFGLTLVSDNIGRTLVAQGKIKDAILYFKKGLTYARQSDNVEWLGNISGHLADAYAKTGDYQNAYQAQRQAGMYEDTLSTRNKDRELAEVEVKYQVKQQQAENNLLKAENALHLSDIRNKNIIAIAAVIFSVLITTLLLLSYRALKIKRRSALIIEEKNARLESLNHEKNSLMAIVAHDLKSPLNSIGGISHILPLAGPLNDEQKKFADMINTIVDNSRVLIQDLLDLSALENREIKITCEPIVLHPLLVGCQAKYQPQAQQKGIALDVVEEAPEGTVISDRHHIERILENLISNALKFSERGTHVALGSRLAGNFVEFYVKDEGPGISPEDQMNLFKKFRKLSARPTQGESSSGLGLSIVKALIDELGGSVRVESEIGKGSNFICSLPSK